ncbi:ras-related protein Rap-1b-like isoform X3 [Histomonas meleagridis]|uniref:ras-related protein Rap-1b-like isoform X3 n=1 Tax=Histomonas meleagridis TaxID=135588 RepID=UPI00355A7BD3|nr:ras-related protein Rap-1b-like isoform X3 [Histomonas meleagridis]KAH0801607.1 ras-related protein Rap-1b-like isoform X3 [Histomonas meleagridis]
MANKIKLLSIGGGAVGKTSLTLQWIKEEFSENYTPTIEEMFEKTVEIDGKKYNIEITDTAGQDEFSTMKYRYIAPSQGFLFVFSITEEKSFSELPSLYKEVLDTKESSSVPCVLAGNKADLRDDTSIPIQKGEQMAQKLHTKYFETSAKEATNVNECFIYLIKQVINSSGSGGCCSIQ